MIIPGKKSMKKRLDDKEILFGTFYKFNCAPITEMLGFAGFDFIIVDGEHGALGYAEIQDIVRAANGVGMDAVVRVASNLQEHILHACDMGAQGVQVPGLKDAEEAAKVADDMRYYPVGHRGFGLTTRAARYTFCDSSEFMDYSNSELLCVIMVEQLEMVKQLDELCQNPLVDLLFIGPGDLSQEVGKPGQTSCPEVLEIAKKITDTALSYGKKVGIFCATPEDVKRAISWGIQYIAFNSDMVIIAKAFKETIKLLNELKVDKTR